MKQLLSLLFSLCWLGSLAQSGVTIPVISQTATSPAAPYSGTVNLYKRADGYLYQKSKLGAEEGLKIDARTNELPKLYMLISSVRSSTLSSSASPLSIYVGENGRRGLFRLDASDAVSADDTILTIVTQAGFRYKRDLDGAYINARGHADAKGDGVTDDTQALQRAINAATKANNPGTYAANSPSNGFSNVVYIPHGLYKITHELYIKGSVTILMDMASSYGGTRAVQVTAGQHLFHIIKDSDNISSGVHFVGGILKAGSATSLAGTALVYGGSSPLDANNHSTDFDNVWFQTPESYAIHIKQGDDIHIRNCRFDVSPYHSIRLGDSTHVVTNASIEGCTFFDIRAGAIDLISAEGLSIRDNKVYWNSANRIPYFVSVLNPSVVTRLRIRGNEGEGVNQLFISNASLDNVSITQNSFKDCRKAAIQLAGGGVYTRFDISHNALDGNFKDTLPGGYEGSPLFMQGTGLQYSLVVGNNLYHTSGGTVNKPIQLDTSRVTGSIVHSNVTAGYSAPVYTHNTP
ncbi:right-handed parallel beta-helix repeat-containing protein [Spirosoma sp. 48-14]|uniref:right-handed parallel beta-helix repeat-containing protein n=1 Tax=Spirosoma sp. 48-14 TaxID=1895854 RepID=UPI00095AE303|nr:right-handed parallel beta-helix repeat-containing protein [Spirosoma sp. 48-14]OJW75716.1 MAG: hypothetical protein BGO59_09125 [Spirosoma sp. 48-14]